MVDVMKAGRIGTRELRSAAGPPDLRAVPGKCVTRFDDSKVHHVARRRCLLIPPLFGGRHKGDVSLSLGRAHLSVDRETSSGFAHNIGKNITA